jgi:hypothetical protein
MPGSFLISSRLALTALPPKTGHFSNTADNIPGKADVDAEDRLAGGNRHVLDTGETLADDLEVLRILELQIGWRGRRERRGAC